MGIIGRIGDYLERSGVSMFSKDTLTQMEKMNDKGAYQSCIVAVDFALSMQDEYGYDSFIFSRLLLEPHDFSYEDRIGVYRMLQESYANGLKELKKTLSLAKKYGGEDIARGEFNFKLMAMRIIMFNIAYSMQMIDKKVSSAFYDKIYNCTKGNNPEMSFDDFIKRVNVLDNLGVSHGAAECKKQEFDYYKNTISGWAYRGVMDAYKS